MNPLVSAVIPTHNRAQMVCRAIKSALNQTYVNLEVVVVVDGPDANIVNLIEGFCEPRLRVVELKETEGPAEARNVGVRAAKGQWIAFLDDDDEWITTKIEKQVALLEGANPSTNFISCRWQEADTGANRALPRTFPQAEEHWSEYIYCRPEFLLPSTWFVKRDLMLAVAFTPGLFFNEDADWLLRARDAAAIVPAFMDDILTIYHNEKSILHMTTKSNWETMYKWAVGHRNRLLTRRAFSYCLIRQCSPSVGKARTSARTSLFLLREAVSKGDIDFYFCIYAVYVALFGAKARYKVRVFVDRIRGNTLFLSNDSQNRLDAQDAGS
jgi:glycosyltransferase involved in cell wall biosynthesis